MKKVTYYLKFLCRQIYYVEGAKQKKRKFCSVYCRSFVVNSGTHGKNTPGTHIMGRVPSSLTPTCDWMKIVINLAKASLDICLFTKKIFNPTILLVPNEKYDFARLVKFGDLEQKN